MSNALGKQVYIRLVGGLGNQLFQYATARALALRTKSELVLDIRAYSPDNPFSYGLDRFAIDARAGNPDELPPPKSNPVRYAVWRLFGSSPKFVRENGLGFNASVMALGADVYLHGYFQTEKYFSACADQLRSELAFAEPPNGRNADWLETISASPSAVSLHVRRGDYVSSSRAEKTHGTCSPEYYRAAVDLIAEKKNIDPVIHVFSDDPKWASENLRFRFETRVIDHNDGATAHEDMRLMSACAHNVIANSTFSWWGAWLNSNPDKTVIAPERWFADPRLDNPDILPESWIAI